MDPQRRCQHCGHRYARDAMFIFTAPGLSKRVCRECYLYLVQKYLGYCQAELQLPKEVTRSEEDLPF